MNSCESTIKELEFRESIPCFFMCFFLPLFFNSCPLSPKDLQAAAMDFLQAWKLPAEVLKKNKGRIRVLLKSQDLPQLRRLGGIFLGKRMGKTGGSGGEVTGGSGG